MRQCLKERPVGVSLPVVEVNLQYLKRKLHGAEDVHKVASREEGSSDDKTSVQKLHAFITSMSVEFYIRSLILSSIESIFKILLLYNLFDYEL